MSSNINDLQTLIRKLRTQLRRAERSADNWKDLSCSLLQSIADHKSKVCSMSKPIRTRETVSLGYRVEEKDWTYNEMLEIFSGDDSNFVVPLIYRCQGYEEEAAKSDAKVKDLQDKLFDNEASRELLSEQLTDEQRRVRNMLDEVRALKAIVSTKLHQRLCWECGHTFYAADSIVPYCLCDNCGSQDTRRAKVDG